MKEDWVEIEYKDAVIKISTSKQKLKQSEYLQTGKIPVVDQGQQLIGGFTDDESRVLDCKLPVVIFGDHTKISKLINFSFAPGADGTKVLQPIECILPKYLAFLTEILVFKIKDKGYARHYQYIEKELLPLSSLPEQRAIVLKIENLFTSLDKGISDLKTAQEQLKVYRQAVLQKAFKGEFTNIDVKEGELAEGWKWVKIDSLLESEKNALKAGPFGSSLKKEFYVKDGYKIYGQEQVISGNPFYGDYYIDEQKYQELFSCRVKPGDILISLVGTVGKVLVLPDNIKEGIINPRLVKISLDKSKYDKLFFKYYFESSKVKSIYKIDASGTTMNVLNVGIIKKIPFPLPPTLAEQHTIVREIESRLSVCDKVEQSITEALEKAEALRQSILKKAFEGKLLNEAEIVKCKQEADYEPASELLKKIKAEKK